MNEHKTIRTAVVNPIRKMLQIYLEQGVVTVDEYNLITDELIYLAKHGKNKPAILPKLITPKEAAELLAISYSQFRTLEKEGTFPFKRRMIGDKTVRYLNTEVLNYMERGAIQDEPLYPSEATTGEGAR